MFKDSSLEEELRVYTKVAQRMGALQILFFVIAWMAPTVYRLQISFSDHPDADSTA